VAGGSFASHWTSEKAIVKKARISLRIMQMHRARETAKPISMLREFRKLALTQQEGIAMTKKLFILFALIAVVSGGAFAQLAFGVSGALHSDQQMSASGISNAFRTGDDIYYGGFVEILGRHFGLGFSFNYSPFSSVSGVDLVNYDADLYLSYHLFRATSFIDPFFEFGLGVLALDYARNSTPSGYNGTSPIAASPYWYGALGLGINLGRHLGIFGKLAYNMLIQRHLTQNGNEIPYYGTYTSENVDPTEYVPVYRFTLGLKLIL
jgi:hypothetical protein